MNMQIRTDEILLALILLFVFLIWLRDNPLYLSARRKFRLFKKRIKNA